MNVALYCDNRVEHSKRSEGPQVNKPGRQAGNRIVDEISAEGAAPQLVSRLRRSFNPLKVSQPDGRAYGLSALWASWSLSH
jgi:hypothetical protein